MAIPAKNLFVPGKLGNLQVKYKDHDFFVIDENNHEFAVERGNLSKELRMYFSRVTKQVSKSRLFCFK